METVTDKQAIQSGLRIFRPHINLAKPTALDFGYLSDQEVIVIVCKQYLHWEHDRTGKVLKVKKARISRILKSAIAKIAWDASR